MNDAQPLFFPLDSQYARVQQNERMIGVESLSGYGLLVPEDEKVDLFDLDVSDEALGKALIDALSNSRLVDPRKELDFFDRDRYSPLIAARRKKIINRSRFRSHRRTHENMRYANLQKHSDNIFIIPHRKRGGKYWEALPDDQKIVIPANSDAQQVGGAAKLALSRAAPIP